MALRLKVKLSLACHSRDCNSVAMLLCAFTSPLVVYVSLATAVEAVEAATVVQVGRGSASHAREHQAQRHQAPHQVQALDRFPAALIVDALVETTAGTSRATVNLVLQASTRRGIVPVDPVLTGGEE